MQETYIPLCEFIVRFCRTVREQITGVVSDALIKELDATADAMSRH
jgi:hypothetical protein